MNPFTPTRPANFPRVALPGVDQDQADRVRSQMSDYVRTRIGYLVAMRAKGVTPYAYTVSTEEKRARRARGRRAKAARKISRK